MRCGNYRSYLLTFFFLSGGCGLIYEVLWMRLLALTLGNTLYSVTTVLTVFMGGLAIGSYLSGLFIDSKKNPLKIYGILEVLVGLYCLFIPSIIVGMEPIFRGLYQYLQPNPYAFSLIKAFILI